MANCALGLSLVVASCASSHGADDGGQQDTAETSSVLDASLPAREDAFDGGADAPRWGRDAGMVARRDSLFWLLAQPDGGAYELPGQYVVLETDYDGRRMGAWPVPDATVERVGTVLASGASGRMTVTTDHAVHVRLSPPTESVDPRFPEHFVLRRLDPAGSTWSTVGPGSFLGGGFFALGPQAPPVASDSGTLVAYRDRMPTRDEPPSRLFLWNGSEVISVPLAEPDGTPIYGLGTDEIVPDVDGSLAVPTRCHEFDSFHSMDCYCRFDPETLDFISYSEHPPANRSSGRRTVANHFLWETEETTHRLEVQSEFDNDIVEGPFYLPVPEGASPVSRDWFVVVSTAVTWDERTVVGLLDGRALLVSEDLRSLTAIHHDYSVDAIVVSVLPSDPYRE